MQPREPSDANPAPDGHNEPGVPSSTSWNEKARQPVKRRPSPIEGQGHGVQEVDSVHRNLPLIALPVAIGLVNINYKAGVAAVAMICAASLVMSNASARIRLTSAALILPAVGAVVALRPNSPGFTANAIFFVLACITIMLTLVNSSSRPSAIVSLFDGIGLLLLAAVAFKAAGIGGVVQDQVAVGNTFTGGERAVFSLIGTAALAPAVAAAYFVAVIPIVRTYSEHRAYRLMGAGFALYVLIQSDRRSALVAVILIAALIVLAPRRFRQFAPWIAAILLLQPLLFRIFEGLVDRAALMAFAKSLPFQRGGTTGGRESLTSRLEIWSNALDFYQDKVDWFYQAVGFGTTGQAESGASLTYRYLFANQPGETTKTAHNSVLQTLFDAGWIGAAGFVLAVFLAARILSRRDSAADAALLAMLASLSFVGSTEALLAPGYIRVTPWWILLAICMIAFSTECSTTEQTEQTEQIADEDTRPNSESKVRVSAQVGPR